MLGNSMPSSNIPPTLVKPCLEGRTCFLRMPERQDAPAIASFYQANQDFFRKTTPELRPGMCEEGFWPSRIDEMHADFVEDRACNLFIFPSHKSAEVIGALNFFAFIRGAFHACICGYQLAESHNGRDIMTEALGLGVDYVFEELSMHRIMANYWPENHASGRVLRKVGFEVEGYARNYLRFGDRWVDHYLTAITHPNWPSPEKKEG